MKILATLLIMMTSFAALANDPPILNLPDGLPTTSFNIIDAIETEVGYYSFETDEGIYGIIVFTHFLSHRHIFFNKDFNRQVHHI